MSDENVNKWTNEKFPKNETTAEKQARFDDWNKKNGHRIWEVTKPSEQAKEKPYTIAKKESRHPFDGNKYPKPYAPDYERPSGVIIYTPHNCERPDAETLPIGTIWECHDYTKKSPDGIAKMCYDQWIIVCDENGNRRWQLFKRSF